MNQWLSVRPLSRLAASAALVGSAVIVGCAQPAMAPPPTAANTWSRPMTARQDVQRALQECGYVDSFRIGPQAVSRQFQCMTRKGFEFNVGQTLRREHCQAADMPAGCAVYWHGERSPH